MYWNSRTIGTRWIFELFIMIPAKPQLMQEFLCPPDAFLWTPALPKPNAMPYAAQTNWIIFLWWNEHFSTSLLCKLFFLSFIAYCCAIFSAANMSCVSFSAALSLFLCWLPEKSSPEVHSPRTKLTALKLIAKQLEAEKSFPVFWRVLTPKFRNTPFL